MSQPAFHFLRHCLRTLFGGNKVFHRTKAATVMAVSAKHASTSTETTTTDPPILEITGVKEKNRNTKWDWLPLQAQYQAARKTMVLCHGLTWKRTALTAGLFGFDKLGFESFPRLQYTYWGGIPEALRQLGCRVLVTKVPR